MKKLSKVLAALVLLSTVLSAQVLDKSNVKNYDQFLTNLEQGINSEIPGIQKASIMIAARHKIKDVVPVLEDVLEETTDNKTKILISLALYEIDEKSSTNELALLTQSEKNQDVKTIYLTLDKIYSNFHELIEKLNRN